MSLFNAISYAVPAFLKPSREATTWLPGQSPLSTWLAVAQILVAYLAIIFAGQELVMKNQKPLKLNDLFRAHNLALAVGSFVLFALLAEQAIPPLFRHGGFYSICNEKNWNPQMETIYMINYYFKYWELFDTVFLFLKKKPLPFLHYYHHSATALLCFIELNGRTVVQWVPILINLGVHVVMYTYYFLTACGHSPWWKKYVTTMQITQFVIDLFVCYYALYSYLAADYFPNVLPHQGTCAGSEGSAMFGAALLTSYLVLFIAFYRKTYNNKGVKGVKKAMRQSDKSSYVKME